MRVKELLLYLRGICKIRLYEFTKIQMRVGVSIKSAKRINYKEKKLVLSIKKHINV